MNIYLVEDDEIYAQFVKKALENSSPKYKIKSFTSAEDAAGTSLRLFDDPGRRVGQSDEVGSVLSLQHRRPERV